MATVTTVDLLKPWLARGRDDRFYLRAARWIAIATAGLMIAGAILFTSIEKESMNDLSWIVASVFGGCLMGLFMVGFFTKRVDGFSAMVALGLAILLNVYLGIGLAGWLPDALTVPVHSYWVGMIVNFAFIAIALVVSCFRNPDRDLTDLTVWTMQKQTRS